MKHLIQTVLKIEEIYLDVNEVPDDIYYADEEDRITDSIHYWRQCPNNNELKSYLFSRFKNTQPHTYQLIENENIIFFYAVKRTAADMKKFIGDITRFGFVLNNQVFLINYSAHLVYEESGDAVALNRRTVPLEFLQSWFYRVWQWQPAETLVMNSSKSRLPSATMITFDGLFKWVIKKNRKEVFSFLEQKFGTPFLTSGMETKGLKDYTELRCLLDTRKNEDYLSSSGFQVFVDENPSRIAPELYVVKNADPFSIKRLVEPVKAVDEYAAHLFSGAAGEFDFFRYAEDF